MSSQQIECLLDELQTQLRNRGIGLLVRNKARSR